MIVILLSFATALYAAEKPKPVAVMAGAVITEDEVNREIGNRLMKLRTEEYNIRRGVLETLVEERLLAAEAKRRGITVDELLKIEVEAKIATASMAEIEPFYEATRERFGGLSREEALQQIAENMRAQRFGRLRAEFVASLRKAAGVKVLLEPPRAVVAANGPARGGENALVTIVEFSDFECSACSRAAPIVRKLEEKYGDKIRVVHRDFPLQIHRGAPRAAEAAHCAGEEGQFWQMHEKLFSKSGAPVTDADIRKYASDLGLDAQKFGACMESGKHTATWKASQAEGNRVGVVSTPTFFINGRMVAGAAPFDFFARIIDEELARTASPGTLSASR